MRYSLALKAAALSTMLAASVGFAAEEAQAFTFNEPPDVPGSISGAEDLTSTPVDAGSIIRGGLRGGADLFQIAIATESEVQFGARGRGSNPALDLQLFLFNSLGEGLLSNDDRSRNNLNPRIRTTLAQGNYFLGISRFDVDPVNARGREIFPDNFRGQRSPRAINNIVLAGFNFEGDEPITDVAGYRINLSATPVPTPALLPGLLAFGAGILRKKRDSETA